MIGWWWWWRRRSRRRRKRRRMETLATVQAESVSPHHRCSFRLWCQSQRRGSERSLSQEAQSSSGLRGAGPDGRPVVWLSCEKGMLGSHVSDGGRVRWLWRGIGGWGTEGATPFEHWPVILIWIYVLPFTTNLSVRTSYTNDCTLFSFHCVHPRVCAVASYVFLHWDIKWVQP